MTELEPQSKEISDRVEHTLLGAGIGALRDSIFGKPTTDEDRQTRAHFNDDMAHLAADVVASLPHIRWFGAGTLRMAMLMDPNPVDAGARLATTALNFAGGAGMNVLGRASSFGFIQKNHALNYGLGAGAEATRHFQTGIALGLTRGITDSRQWVGADGKLQLADPAAIARLGFLSGLSNIPAGFAGGKIAALSSAEGGAFSRIVTGTASGGVSGAAFGGTDGYLRRGDLGDAFDGFVNGGLTGSLAGGITAGAERGRQDFLYAVTKGGRRPPVLEDTRGPLLGTDPLSPKAQAALETHGESLALPSTPPSFAELKARLGKPKLGTYEEQIRDPFGPANFWHSEQYENHVFRPARQALVYEVGGTKIKVPVDYAERLESVRILRLFAEKGDAKAAEHLSSHGLENRLLPEDLIPLLDRLPNRPKVREIELVDKPSAWNRWYEEFNDWGRANKQNGRSFTAAAEANWDLGRIRFFSGTRYGMSRSLTQIWDHEQVHLNHEPQYATARSVDEKVEAHHYGYLNKLESEAELESIAFWGEPKSFIEATERAPVRMSLLAKKLQETLDTSPNGGGTQADGLRKRIAYVMENTKPAANEKPLQLARDRDRSQTLKELSDLYQRINDGAIPPELK